MDAIEITSPYFQTNVNFDSDFCYYFDNYQYLANQDKIETQLRSCVAHALCLNRDESEPEYNDDSINYQDSFIPFTKFLCADESDGSGKTWLERFHQVFKKLVEGVNEAKPTQKFLDVVESLKKTPTKDNLTDQILQLACIACQVLLKALLICLL